MRKTLSGWTARSALIAASLWVVGCSKGESEKEIIAPAQVEEGPAKKAESHLGPVSATISLRPETPILGDLMEVELAVHAEEGVKVTMPAMQEALSHFGVEKQSSSERATENGTRYVQRYEIQAGRTGRLRLPPLRVVFVDERPESEVSDEGGTNEQELLTEEIAVKVAPVDDSVADLDELRPIRSTLEERLGDSLWQRFWWLLLPLGAIVLLITLLVRYRRHRRPPRVSPYERASVALERLEAQGLPDEEGRDEWYVKLSQIVRRYLEDRFSLRAPELTTEEFLRVAQRSSLLRDDHKLLLQDFLALCDQVKFAGYKPDDEESRGVLRAARQFLVETRPSENVGESGVEGEKRGAKRDVA